jgi:hypothetical protein
MWQRALLLATVFNIIANWRYYLTKKRVGGKIKDGRQFVYDKFLAIAGYAGYNKSQFRVDYFGCCHLFDEKIYKIFSVSVCSNTSGFRGQRTGPVKTGPVQERGKVYPSRWGFLPLTLRRQLAGTGLLGRGGK